MFQKLELDSKIWMTKPMIFKVGRPPLHKHSDQLCLPDSGWQSRSATKNRQKKWWKKESFGQRNASRFKLILAKLLSIIILQPILVPLPVSPVCGASWSKIDDLCYKLIAVTDTDVTEVTQAANEVDYANAKVPQTTLKTKIILKKMNNQRLPARVLLPMVSWPDQRRRRFSTSWMLSTRDHLSTGSASMTGGWICCHRKLQWKESSMIAWWHVVDVIAVHILFSLWPHSQSFSQHNRGNIHVLRRNQLHVDGGDDRDVGRDVEHRVHRLEGRPAQGWRCQAGEAGLRQGLNLNRLAKYRNINFIPRRHKVKSRPIKALETFVLAGDHLRLRLCLGRRWLLEHHACLRMSENSRIMQSIVRFRKIFQKAIS